jgi:DNA-binding MarR family transcriptional regulator
MSVDYMSTVPAGLPECNCLAIRQAARHVTQFYDQLFAPVGLRATQFAILTRLRRQGPMTINALAGLLVIDRTTLGRNILPLQRDGLIAVAASPSDRRRRELRLTDAGLAKHTAALECWSVAQQQFEAVFGAERAAMLRRLLREVVAADFTAGPGVGAQRGGRSAARAG